ncbi:MAG: hypothetical protein LBP98_05115 [Tannerella sp.]|nr:hypothetical protein [Tannerella sp.]
MAPANYVFYCMVYDEKHRTGFFKTFLHTWKTGMFFCLLTVTGLLGVLIFAGNATANIHGGLKVYIKAFLYLYGISGCVIPAFAGIICLWRKKTNMNTWIYPLLLFLVITIPQVVLYAPSGIVDRYLIPAMTGCAFLAVYVYRRLKADDTVINGNLWKNISLALGFSVIIMCALVVFNRPLQHLIVNFAFLLQGQGWQKMTAFSSLQYLLNTVPTMAVTGMLVGITLAVWGCRRKKQFVLKVSQLYVGVLSLILLLNGGLAFASCQRYAMRGFATEGFLNTIIANSTANDEILIVGNPIIEGEGIGYGLPTYLKKYNRNNLFIHPLAKGGEEESAAGVIRLYNNKTVDTIANKDDIRIVAIFSGQEEMFRERAGWFDATRYSRYEFTGNYVVYVKD